MKRNLIWQEIESVLKADKRINPNFPDHVAAQAGKVTAEAGRLMEASLGYKYHHGNDAVSAYQLKKMRKSAVSTAAMAIRFLENLK